jgi:hypothetical protein
VWPRRRRWRRRERWPASLGDVGGDGGAREVGYGGTGAQHDMLLPQAPLHHHVQQQPREPRRRPLLKNRRHRVAQQRRHRRTGWGSRGWRRNQIAWVEAEAARGRSEERRGRDQVGPGKIGRGWKTRVRIEATAWMYVLHGFFLYDFLGWGWESSWVG